MKVKLSKKVYADMPKQVREVVQQWAQKEKRRDISVSSTDRLYIAEDAKYTLINLGTEVSQTERASGEWAGATKLMCNRYLDLQVGIVAIETRLFMGKAYLTIHQGCGKLIEA